MSQEMVGEFIFQKLRKDRACFDPVFGGRRGGSRLQESELRPLSHPTGPYGS